MDLRPVLKYRFRKFRYLRYLGAAIEKIALYFGSNVSEVTVPDWAPNQPSHPVDVENVFWQTFPPRRFVDRIVRKDSQRLWQASVEIQRLPIVVRENEIAGVRLALKKLTSFGQGPRIFLFQILEKRQQFGSCQEASRVV